ncbi:hypothetical protein [Nonomuraea rubra]|uniref:Uncharacterized protein n=1 Tax=Nonomuraea rubra TaxID=46180 RepID=A0A7X0U638_9ACTN|nr:hypothetical protein [Nonomuraea rubra]MBB6556214.1 hypothetical protein [Nonomuraea rubra]
MSPDLAARVEALEAERLHPSRDEVLANPLRDLIGLLDRLLSDPPPADPVPGPPDRPTPEITEETNHG